MVFPQSCELSKVLLSSHVITFQGRTFEVNIPVSRVDIRLLNLIEVRVNFFYTTLITLKNLTRRVRRTIRIWAPNRSE